MIPLSEFKRLLGDLADTMSEGEILELRRQQTMLANIAFDMWIEENNSRLTMSDNRTACFNRK